MWDTGVQGIQDHLIWGIGYNNDKNVMDHRKPLAEKTIIVLTTAPVQEFTTFICKHG